MVRIPVLIVEVVPFGCICMLKLAWTLIVKFHSWCRQGRVLLWNCKYWADMTVHMINGFTHICWAHSMGP